ncbi:MAG: chitobiase/beta-hexosaminidase C-terminal domain-containing protein [Limisphaerales bacterium]
MFASWQGGGSGSDVAPGSPASLLPVGGSGGSGSGSSGSGSGLFLPDYTFTSSYLNYTNFWLTITNNSTNAFVSVESTLSNLTYEILTNSSLASTNWGVWHTYLASSSNTPAPPVNLNANVMFFRSALVWSTGTNGLPDWWQMNYFGQLGVNPNGNPAGDGINNLDKYILGLNPNISYASQLIITPPGGNYITTPTVTIFSLNGSSIKYTTNGSIPSATNGITIESGVTIASLPGGSFTLKAWESGLTNVPASATYTIIPATPTFSILSGLCDYGTTLQINDATANAVVYYTTNGIDPTTNSLQAPMTGIILTTNVTIKAAAVLGTNISPVAQAEYIVALTNPPPNDNFSNAAVLSGVAGEFTGTTLNATLEFFETNNSSEFYWNDQYGNSVWYKWVAPSNGTALFICDNFATEFDFYIFTNGSSNPTNLVSVSADQSYFPLVYYTLPVTQNVAYYVSVTAYEEGPFDASWQYVGPTPAPIFSPDAGTYQTGQLVTVSDNDTNATIYYTLNGSTPTTNSPIISPGVTVFVTQTETLKAAAWDPELDESAIKTALYTINPASTNPTQTASAPVLSPINQTFTSSITVTLSCTNSGATIYYTLDGSIPTTTSASVASGGTVTITSSAVLNATAGVTGMNLSPITTSQYAKLGVDTAGDGIPDSGKLAIGADILISDATEVNPNPDAHGLDNMQVYQNQSVLLADNYSTENDGIPDWWLVQYGYSVTTSASALGNNGQTLLVSYSAGLNPNDPNSQPGQLPPIDFHMVHGPTNSMVMVLDTVRPGMAFYRLTASNTDQGLPSLSEDFAANQSLDAPSNGLGRYFEMTNALPPGYWSFTLQGSNTLWSAMSSNIVTCYQENCQNGVTEEASASTGPLWFRFSGIAIPVVGYTNKGALKFPLLAQWLRQESEVTDFGTFFEDGVGWSVGPIIYNDAIPSAITSEDYWGTLTFGFNGDGGYNAVDYASYFQAFCGTPDSPLDCSDYYPAWYGPGFPGSELGALKITNDNNNSTYYFYMPGGTFNPAGLSNSSLIYRIAGQAPVVLLPGDSNAIPTMSSTFEVAVSNETPSFQTINFYFDPRQYPVSSQLGDNQAPWSRTCPPLGFSALSPPQGWMLFETMSFPEDWWIEPDAVTNPVVVAQVGRPVNLQAWEQVLAVRLNGVVLTNQSYWIDQDIGQAYLCNPVTGDVPRTNQLNYNGEFKIDTNAAVQTGIMSPSLDFTNVAWGNQYFGQRGAQFTPTQPGKVIVTTMPDANGNYGEVTIYVIDMQVDANDDGVMDNRDLTSVDNPMVFWVNNDVDRWHTIDVTDEEQDDLQVTSTQLESWQQVPDCQYQNGIGQYAIPCTRDLEDYARLWIPGLTNLMQVLPSGYGINLQWRNGTGAGIRIFGAADADGGTNYLFDGTTSSNQVDTGWYPCFGYVTSDQPLAVSASAWNSLNGYPPSDHFIFCGTAYGNDELVLQVTNQYGGEVGEASVFLNLKDIKQMYERWSVGEDPTQLPSNIATNCGDQGIASCPYPYDGAVDSTTPYILHVHGSNMETWEKDRFAETMFKRLYWQGYQGRFGSFRWPTASGFNPLLDEAAVFYSGIENVAWQSGIGLKNLLTRLNILYPDQVQLSAHSMGNITAGEALRQATTTLVQTYTAFQGSVPAHAYDPNAPTLSLGSADVGEPNVYAHYWTPTNDQYFADAIGAASYVNFFNTNDFVLDHWLGYQPDKPVTALGYDYISSQYYQGVGSDPTIMTFPTDTYPIFAFCQQAKCNCIGEQENLGGQFTFLGIPQQINVLAAPYGFGVAHKGHSAEFRSDNMSRAVFWNQVLIQMDLK